MNRFLPENTKNDLERGDAFRAHAEIRLFHRLHAHPEIADLPFAFQLAQMLEYLALLQHVEGHAVQLREIERLHAESPQRRFRVQPNPRPRKILRPARRRKPPELRRHIRGPARARRLRQKFPDQRLRPPHPIHVRRIKERRPRLPRRPQRRQRRLLAHVAPARAELPRAQADFTDAASRATENPCIHRKPACDPSRTRQAASRLHLTMTRSQPAAHPRAHRGLTDRLRSDEPAVSPPPPCARQLLNPAISCLAIPQSDAFLSSNQTQPKPTIRRSQNLQSDAAKTRNQT